MHQKEVLDMQNVKYSLMAPHVLIFSHRCLTELQGGDPAADRRHGGGWAIGFLQPTRVGPLDPEWGLTPFQTWKVWQELGDSCILCPNNNSVL